MALQPKLLADFSVESNNQSFNNLRFTPPGCKDLGIKKFNILAEISFFSGKNKRIRKHSKNACKVKNIFL